MNTGELTELQSQDADGKEEVTHDWMVEDQIKEYKEKIEKKKEEKKKKKRMEKEARKLEIVCSPQVEHFPLSVELPSSGKQHELSQTSPDRKSVV